MKKAYDWNSGRGTSRALALLLAVVMIASAVFSLVLTSVAQDSAAQARTGKILSQTGEPRTLTAGDGQTYEISVTLDGNDGIPQNASLSVREIPVRDPSYADYVEESAEALGEDPSDFGFARVFDISLTDPATGEVFQPDREVPVNIRLLDTSLFEAGDIEAVHFGEQTEAVDCALNGNALRLEADGFSVYVVVSLPSYDAVNDLSGGVFSSGGSYAVSWNGWYMTANGTALGQTSQPSNAAFWTFTPTGTGFLVHSGDQYLRRNGSGWALSSMNNASIITVTDTGNYHTLCSTDGGSTLYLGYNSGFKGVASPASLLLVNDLELNGDFVLYMQDINNKLGAMMAKQGNNSPPETRAVQNLSTGGYTWSADRSTLTVAAGKTEPTIWTIEKAGGEGLTEAQARFGHYVSTQINGETRYLHLGAVSGSGVRAELSFQSDPELIYVSADAEGRVRFVNQNGFAANLGQNKIDSNRFGSWYDGKVGAYEWFRLALLSGSADRQIHTIQYVFTPAEGTEAVPLDMPVSRTVVTTDSSHVLAAPVQTVYHAEDAENLYTYTFQYWEIGGSLYAPGQTLPLIGGEVIITPVWELTNTAPRPEDRTSYISCEGYYLTANSDFTRFYSDLAQNNDSKGISFLCNPAKATLWQFEGVFTEGGQTGYKISDGAGHYISVGSGGTSWALTTDPTNAAVFSLEKIEGGEGLPCYHISALSSGAPRYLGLGSGSKNFNTIRTSTGAGEGTELLLTPAADYSGSYVLYLEYDDVASLVLAVMEETLSGNSNRRKDVSFTRQEQEDGTVVLDTSVAMPTVWTLQKADSTSLLPGYTVQSAETGKYLTLNGGSLVLSDSPSVLYLSLRQDGSVRLVSEGGRAISLEGLGKGFNGRSTNSNMEWLRLLEARRIQYDYPKAASPDHDPVNLPASEVAVAFGSSYTVKDPYRRTYYFEKDGDNEHRYVYTFASWQQEGGDPVQPGTVLDLSGAPGNLVFQATWTGPVKMERPYVVRYSVGYYTDKNGNLRSNGDLPSTTGDPREEVELIDGAEYMVQDLTDHYYYSKVNTRMGYHTEEFKGWRTETGELIKAGASVDLSKYDPDRNRYIDLEAVWAGDWMAPGDSTGLPSVKFSIWKNTDTAEDQISLGAMLDENVSNYSPTVCGAIMHALDENGNVIYSDELISPARGSIGKPNYGLYLTVPSLPKNPQGKYMMISYAGSSIMESDAAVRQLASSEGYLGPPIRSGERIRWQLSRLPSDEEVLEFLRLNRVEMIGENNQPIPFDQLTTDNFAVRWCHVKYQSGEGDGWNINAKLTRKISYTTITKTFEGTQAVIDEAIRNGFNITLTDTRDASQVVTLRMVDKTETADDGSQYKAARIDGSDYEYGYRQVTRNPDGTITYTWVVVSNGTRSYLIKENNYTVSTGGMTYGISVQYSQNNTGDPAVDGVRKLWSSNTQIRATAQGSDNFQPSRFVTTNFYNRYLPEGILQIDVLDDTGRPIKGTVLRVYDKNGNLKALTYDSLHGLYNVLYENAGETNQIVTGSNGTVYLKLDHGSEYIIREDLPAGYVGKDWTDPAVTPSFRVTVDGNGLFRLSDENMPAACGRIDFGTQEEVTSHVQLTHNVPVQIAVRKTVAEGTSAEDFTFTARLSVDGTGIPCQNVIGQADTNSGGEATFTLRAGGTQQLTFPRSVQVTFTENLTEKQQEEYETSVAIPGRTVSGRVISFPVTGNNNVSFTNTVRSKKTQKVILKKVDSSNTPLAGAVFSIQLLGSDGTIQKTVASGLTSNQSGVFYIDYLAYGTYRAVETTPPPGGYTAKNFTFVVNENGVSLR